VVGPEHLLAVGEPHRLEGLLAGMRGGEGGVAGGVPILGHHHVLELLGEPIDHRDHGVALLHGQAPAGEEAVLDVDHEEGVGPTGLGRGAGEARGEGAGGEAEREGPDELAAMGVHGSVLRLERLPAPGAGRKAEGSPAPARRLPAGRTYFT
jgi:hypothetical protein